MSAFSHFVSVSVIVSLVVACSVSFFVVLGFVVLFHVEEFVVFVLLFVLHPFSFPIFFLLLKYSLVFLLIQFHFLACWFFNLGDFKSPLVLLLFFLLDSRDSLFASCFLVLQGSTTLLSFCDIFCIDFSRLCISFPASLP